MSLHFKGFKPEPCKSMRPPSARSPFEQNPSCLPRQLLILQSNGNAQSVTAYTITTEEEEPVYTVSGRNFESSATVYHHATASDLVGHHSSLAVNRL